MKPTEQSTLLSYPNTVFIHMNYNTIEGHVYDYLIKNEHM